MLSVFVLVVVGLNDIVFGLLVAIPSSELPAPATTRMEEEEGEGVSRGDFFASTSLLDCPVGGCGGGV